MKKTIYPIFLSFVMGLAMLPANAENSIASARSTLLSEILQSKLQTHLKLNDYNNFYSNLEDFSSPYSLKNGSKFYEARRDELGSASAIVIDPEGYFYLAYKMPESNEIKYITNDGSCNKEAHDAIKVFANTFQGNNKIIFSNSIKVNNRPHVCNEIYGNLILRNGRLKRSYSYMNLGQQ